jgi:hypothetical protein
MSQSGPLLSISLLSCGLWGQNPNPSRTLACQLPPDAAIGAGRGILTHGVGTVTALESIRYRKHWAYTEPATRPHAPPHKSLRDSGEVRLVLSH